jgi:zinc transport system ATP-binding protein
MSIIEANNLTLAYNGYIAAENITFSLDKGDYLCVVGENGSGKSTLLKAVTGEIKPAAGKLEIDKTVKSEGIGYLPQQSKIQRDFPATVREVVLSGCVNRDKYGMFWNDDSKKRALEAMKMMNLLPLEKKSFGELSGGQKQRTLLARAICVSDKLLLLDEPVTGLDPDAAHEMYAAIRMINRELGCAVMMVTHDIGCAVREADKMLSMCRGHYFFGSVDGYLNHEKHDEEVHEHAEEEYHHHG